MEEIGGLTMGEKKGKKERKKNKRRKIVKGRKVEAARKKRKDDFRNVVGEGKH